MNVCFLAEEEGTLFVRCDVEVFGEWRTALGISISDSLFSLLFISFCRK